MSRVQGDVRAQKSVVDEIKKQLQSATAPFVEVNANTGELRVRRQSTLGATLQQLGRPDEGPDASQAAPDAVVGEIRTLLRVRTQRCMCSGSKMRAVCVYSVAWSGGTPFAVLRHI